MADFDRRSSLFDSYENAAVIISGIGTAQLGHPTPCPKYDVAALIDHLVEAGRRAAALGRGESPPPGDVSPHVELSEAPGERPSAKVMIDNLLKDHEAVIQRLRDNVQTVGDKYGDMGTQDFLTGLMEQHEKMAWMIRAHLG